MPATIDINLAGKREKNIMMKRHMMNILQNGKNWVWKRYNCKCSFQTIKKRLVCVNYIPKPNVVIPLACLCFGATEFYISVMFVC